MTPRYGFESRSRFGGLLRAVSRRPDRFVRRDLDLWRSGRWVILAALAVGVTYSLAVLITVAMTGDIGLRCIFSDTIHAVEPSVWRVEVGPAGSRLGAGSMTRGDHWSPGPPRAGDVLLQVGPWTVENYHQYVVALRGISTRIGEFADVRWERPQEGQTYRGQVRIDTPPPTRYAWSVVWFLQEMIVFGVGAWVYWKRPRDESARVFFWLCVVTVGAFMGGYHWTRIVVFWPLIYAFAAFAVFVPIFSLHFYLVFPRTNPLVVVHRRRVLTTLYSVPLLALVAMWGCMLWSAQDTANVLQALDLLRHLALGYVWLSVALFMLCLACLVYSFRRARTRSERNQVQWILLASLLSLIPIAYLLWDTWNAPERLGMTRSVWPMFVVSLLYTAAYATSITRYRLMQAEALLSRGVLYFLVSLAAGLLYSGVLVVFTLVIGERITPDKSLEALVAGLTAIVILVMTELARLRFHRAIDSRFDREKIKFDVAMRKMSRAVGSLVDRDTMARRLLEAIAEVLPIDWAAIYLSLQPSAQGPLELAACQGPEPDERRLELENPLVVALRRRPGTVRGPQALDQTHDPAADAMIALGGELAAALEADGILLGLVILGPKRSGQRYEPEELAFLGALSSLSGLALRSSGIQATLENLNRDLREKVEKIAEQQRRILILQSQLTDRGQADAEPSDGAPAVPPTERESSAFGAIRGRSLAIRRMVDVARKVASSPSAVLIRGESGTGKELLAEAIHRASPRGEKPFVRVHCAALAQGLLESELFGHVKGAFTGADRDRIGRFQQADGGTLFLDEIGDINWEVQTKLLRVLQETAFERVGSSQTITVDVRIVAATNQNLEALIRAGRFREDLYYRLNVISLITPALRDRKEDVFELAVHFLNVHTRRAGKPISHLDDLAIEALVAHDWPGNVRELENVIERAVVLADGPAICLDDLPAEVLRLPSGRRRARLPVLAGTAAAAGAEARRRGASGRSTPSGGMSGEKDSSDFAADLRAEGDGDNDPDEFDRYERLRLLDALREANGNKSSAARLLAMPRSTFFSKLKKHGIA